MNAEVKKLADLFYLSPEAMKNSIGAFHREMRDGLSGKNSSLKMLPTFVDNPLGREKGAYMAFDLGGTSFRVLMVRLMGNGTPPQIIAREKYYPGRATFNATGEILFGALADGLKMFLEKHRYFDAYKLGFTFSFPMQQTRIAQGKLITWTKEITASGVVGENVVALLNAAIFSRNIQNVEVVSINNDTTGTQVARAYTDEECDIGGIIGTGTNFGYRENVSEIKKSFGKYDAAKMIINLESGNFNKKLPLTPYDEELDRQSENPGQQLTEKMVAGEYLGEIARLVITDLAARGFLFNGVAPGAFAVKNGFETIPMSAIESDQSPERQGVCAELRKLGINHIKLEEAKLIQNICILVSTRAARMAATILAAVVLKIDGETQKKHTIAIDGSLFSSYFDFQRRMRAALKDIFGEEKAALINLKPTPDGSGVGAAIIAAVVSLVKPGH